MAIAKAVSAEQIAEIKGLRRVNKDKKAERRLRAVQLRGEGYSNSEIAVMVEAHPKAVSKWICAYLKYGAKALETGHYGGNRRNMSVEEEAAFLAQFDAAAERGEEVTAREIKAAYVEKVGHSVGSGQIYYVFKRQNWRKVVPRKAHPKKAAEAEIDASKKLTFE